MASDGEHGRHSLATRDETGRRVMYSTAARHVEGAQRSLFPDCHCANIRFHFESQDRYMMFHNATFNMRTDDILRSASKKVANIFGGCTPRLKY